MENFGFVVSLPYTAREKGNKLRFLQEISATPSFTTGCDMNVRQIRPHVINNHGQVIGLNFASHVLMWDPMTGIHDLGPGDGIAINDADRNTVRTRRRRGFVIRHW
jgi:hypothetical protein